MNFMHIQSYPEVHTYMKMNILIWFFIYPLLSLGCDANYRYVVWTPRPGDTLFSDVALALPDISMKEFAKLNPGVDTNKLRTDPASPYKLPYSPQMTIIPPAVWSGDCPKTLLLDGEQQALSHTQYGTTPTPTKSGHHKTGATSITGSSEEITTIASTELSTSTEPTGSGATNDAQDLTVNPTTGSATEPKETISSIATSEKPASTFRTVTEPTSTYRSSPTSNSKKEAGKPEPACYKDNGSTLQTETRLKMEQSFCNAFKKVPFTYSDWKKVSHETEIEIGISFVKDSRYCQNYKVDDMICKGYLEGIEGKCKRPGGFVWDECILISVETYKAE
ncbi:hypothetical protein IWW34DRAFT_825343 [Fusarium oxysporum f. sp. albedinis]|nr:hypothetical protein IWW34DRAFT_825343 [Fusarium oxysporum f. sp. albedinis]